MSLHPPRNVDGLDVLCRQVRPRVTRWQGQTELASVQDELHFVDGDAAGVGQRVTAAAGMEAAEKSQRTTCAGLCRVVPFVVCFLDDLTQVVAELFLCDRLGDLLRVLLLLQDCELRKRGSKAYVRHCGVTKKRETVASSARKRKVETDKAAKAIPLAQDTR